MRDHWGSRQAPPRLDHADNFPGWARASAYLKEIIVAKGLKRIADLGGGANPLLDDDFLARNGIEYYLIDISQEELDKAKSSYRKIQLDIMCGEDVLAATDLQGRFDLVFSHMFLEHIGDPRVAHSNIRRLLVPGGLSVHFYPSPNNLPLLVNRVLPEAISQFLVRYAQPGRDLDDTQQKFKAYYKLCGPPSQRLRRFFSSVGFNVVRHTGYVGHEYYDRVPTLARLERKLRNLVLRLKLPLISKNLLVLERVR